MKKLILLSVILLTSICHAKAQQDIVERCITEITPIMERANSIWGNDSTLYAMTSERAERYAFYCLQVCDIADKYKNHITDVKDRISLLWLQVELLSRILSIYEEYKYGLTSVQYPAQLDRKVKTLESIFYIVDDIVDRTERDFSICIIIEALGKHYFNQENYREAQDYYSLYVSKYNDIIAYNSIDTDIVKIGQQAYYWLGYTAYKLGEIDLARNYYNKAKNILNDGSLVEYK